MVSARATQLSFWSRGLKFIGSYNGSERIALAICPTSENVSPSTHHLVFSFADFIPTILSTLLLRAGVQSFRPHRAGADE